MRELRMPHKIFKAWIERLREGKKAKGVLASRRGGRCCLGHLAEVAGETFIPTGQAALKTEAHGSTLMLKDEVRRRVGMKKSIMTALAVENDATIGFDSVIEMALKFRREKRL